MKQSIQCWRMRLKKKSIKKGPKKWPELTCQTEMTLWKANKNKLWISIPNQPNSEGCD
jgi:hypothetical protein